MLGTCSFGIQAPIYRGEGNILDFICNALSDASSEVKVQDGDVIGITESLVARSQNNYCTVDDIAKSAKELFYDQQDVVLYEPIASRNRFSLILKGIARAYKHIDIVWQDSHDEVGNNLVGQHPFTGIDYKEFYQQIVESEGSTISFCNDLPVKFEAHVIDCRCHPTSEFWFTLKDIMKKPVIRENGIQSGFNAEFGILGSNVAGDDRLKLFPRDGQEFVTRLKQKIKTCFNADVECLIYGDGCFKDPKGGIWEFADPITCPGSTIPWWITPHENKLKLLAETKTDEEIKEMIADTYINPESLGTTPRRTNDLLASLMDLTSGSGDKGTPIILVKNYFNRYGQ